MNTYFENTAFHQHLKMREAINNFLFEIKSEDSFDNRSIHLTKLKNEIGNIFSKETIQGGLEKVKKNLIQAQNYVTHTPANLIRDFINDRKETNIRLFKSLNVDCR